MSLSGALLVFADEMKSTTEEKWLQVDNPTGSYNYDASFQNIRKTYPGWEALTYEQPPKKKW